MSNFFGIDWGGTYIKAGVVDSQGKILRKVLYSSKNFSKKEVFIDKVLSLLGQFKGFKLQGIGIGAPGIIDTKKGSIYYLPNIPGWRNYPLGSILKKKARLPVFIDNDANVFGLAESRLGAGKGKSRGIFLTLGTGLGSSVIFNGNLLEGKTSSAELGHVPMSLKGKLCGCGAKGCIETFVGGKYLLKKYNSLNKGRTKVKEIKDIFYRALKGEKKSLIIWEEFSFALGRFLAGMVNIFNPEVIVFGGGISGAFKLFKPLVWDAIKTEAMWPQVKGLKLKRAKLKNSTIIGASLLAKEGLKEHLIR